MIMRRNQNAMMTATVFAVGLMVGHTSFAQTAPDKTPPGQPSASLSNPQPPPPGPVVIQAHAVPGQAATGALANNVIAWDADLKEATVKAGETQAHFTFNLTNVSSGEVTILAVSPGCGCTVAQLQSPLPWKLSPGASSQIPLIMNVAPNAPALIKTVTVSTDHGAKTLMIKAAGPPLPAPTPASAAPEGSAPKS